MDKDGEKREMKYLINVGFLDIYPREYLVIGNQYHFEIVALAMLGILKEKN
jgi:hypothetical protein